MLELWDDIINIYKEYVGTGMVMALFLASMAYLWLEDKKTARKLALAVVPTITLLLFFTPFFGDLVYRYLDNETYYRFLWLLPVVPVIAYAGVKLLLRLQGIKRLIALVACCGILVVCGDFVYDNPYFTKAENPYHVPNEVAEICDSIIMEGREVKAVFPMEMVQYVRQYTPYVLMAFGREMLVEDWRVSNSVYEEYTLGITQASKLVKATRNNGCHYIIWDTTREMSGSLEKEGLEKVNTVGKYDIYLDSILLGM